MNGLQRLDKFAPSKTPYAFHPDTFIRNPNGLSRVLAVWAGRKNGRTTAATGWLVGRKQETYEEFIETVDMRYGGGYEGKWDGVSLVTSQAIAESQRQTLVSNLMYYSSWFPDPPPNFDGWYYRR